MFNINIPGYPKRPIKLDQWEGYDQEGRFCIIYLYKQERLPTKFIYYYAVYCYNDKRAYEEGENPISANSYQFDTEEEAREIIERIFSNTSPELEEETSEALEEVEEERQEQIEEIQEVLEEVVDEAEEAAKERDSVLNEYFERMDEIRRQYEEGLISEEEARNQRASLDAWLQTQLNNLANKYPGIFVFEYDDIYLAQGQDWLTGESLSSWELVEEWIELDHTPAYNENGYYNMRDLHSLTQEGKGPFDVFINQGGEYQLDGNLKVKGTFDIAGADSAPIVTAIEADTLQLEVRDRYKVQGSIYFSSTTDKNVLIDEGALQFDFEAGDRLELNPARVLRDGNLISGVPNQPPFIQIRLDDIIHYSVSDLSSIDLTKFRSYSERRLGTAETGGFLDTLGDVFIDTWDELRNRFIV